ncbi:MAG: hypothetical protein JF609_02960 [Verrucomicrobia bacterium]|nr:hypothetical protein [Verrucomicrobiota bacterium]
MLEASENPDSTQHAGRLRPDQIQVTTGEIQRKYEIVGMVCFTTGTRGQLRNQFESLKTVTAHKLADAKSKGQVSESRSVGQVIHGVGIDSSGDLSLTGQYSGASFRSSDMEIAFHMTVNQLQLRASFLNANAIIGFRYDIDFDSNANVLNFMATGYGTAVRIIE